MDHTACAIQPLVGGEEQPLLRRNHSLESRSSSDQETGRDSSHSPRYPNLGEFHDERRQCSVREDSPKVLS